MPLLQPGLLAAVAVIAQPALARGAPIGGGSPPKDSPAMKKLQCDACLHVMHELSKDVKYLVESDKMWKPQDLKERIQVSCLDPSMPTGAFKDACSMTMLDYHESMAREIALRWTEDADEFEEDIVPTEFCQKVGICKEGQKTINQMISESDRREKDLAAEKQEKEKAAERR